MVPWVLAFALVATLGVAVILLRRRPPNPFIYVSCLLTTVALFLLAGVYVEARWNVTDLSRRLLVRQMGLVVPVDAATRSALRFEGKPFPTSRVAVGLAEVREWQAAKRTMLAGALGFEQGASNSNEALELLSEELLDGGITRTLVRYQAADGARIPSFLLQPAGGGPFPVVLVIPGHVREGQSGLAQTAGLVDSYQHSAALALARAGFLTFTLELRGFGYLGEPYNTEHRIVAWNAILAGGSYKGLVLNDIRTAVDLVTQLPQVDRSRVAITGVSYGGELAVTYAALDPRIQVVVFQGFGGSVGPWRGKEGGADDQPHYCHVIPGLRTLLLQEELFYLLAPRPVLGVRGTRDAFSSEEFAGRLRDEWSRFGADAMIELKLHEGGHEYFAAPAIEFFDRHLKVRP